MDIDLQAALEQATEKIAGWAEALVQNLPNLVVAGIVVVLFWIVARIAARGARSVAERITAQSALRTLLSKVAFALVLVAGLFVALGVLGLDKTVTSLLAGVGIVGLALGFAFQDIAENFIAGVLISVRRPFSDGDLVETNDHFGTVDHVDLRATTLRTPEGQIVKIPNADVFQNPLVNYSTLRERRVDVRCGVSYGDDLEEAARVAVEAVSGVEGRDGDRDVELFWEAFGGSSIDFVVRFWIPFERSQADWLRARSEAIARIKAAFDREGVGIPFPITTLDFGEAGGTRLSEELEGLGVLGSARGGEDTHRG